MRPIPKLSLFSFCFTALFFWSSIALVAQELMPSVSSCNSRDYNAASQNWGITSDSHGVVYAANNEGLLRFDGQRWETYTLPNKTSIRSVFCHDGLIYTGSYEEFGVWKNDKYGKLHYNSLSDLIDTTYTNEEFWQITSWDDAIVFRSFGKLYHYYKNDIKAYQPDFIITSLIHKGDELILGSNMGQLYRFTNGSFEQLQLASNLESAIIDLATYKDSLLAGTRFSGLYKLQDDLLVPFGSMALQEFLEINELNKIEVISNDLIILGTIKGGLAYYNPNTGKFKNHYRQNGLQNNTILSLHHKDDRVWVGLDNGIDAVIPNAAVKYFSDDTGQLGAVYDLIHFKDNLYLGSNTGVHRITEQGFEFIPGSQGQVWSFTLIEDRLFVNHNLGLFELLAGSLQPVSEATGSYGITAIPGENRYLNSTYSGIKPYTFGANGLQPLTSSSLGGVPVEKIVFEDSRNFWATHPYKGFYRARLTDKKDNFEKISSFDSKAPLTAYETEIHLIEGQMAFYNGGNWYRYNGIHDSLEHYADLSGYSNYSLISTQQEGYWFKNRLDNGLVYTNFKTDSLYIDEARLENRLIKGYDKLIQINDSIHILTLNEGYANINLAQLKRERSNERDLQTPILQGFSTSRENFSLDQENYEVDHKDAGQLLIAVAAPLLKNPDFYYELSNGESGYFDGDLTFQNLHSGAYLLTVWPEKNGKRGEEPLQVAFNIKRPWYFNNIMLILYVLILVGIILLIRKSNTQKLNRHRAELEQKLIEEQDQKTQIAERNQLLNEINTKRKELANSTYLAAKRNRSLQEIQDELDEIKNRFDNQYKIKNIQSKINHILEAKDNWKVFETNFKEINNDFFQQLLKDYPSLSSKDLKLCAYLKMNLTTKEIAPLMAISVRGVEIHRYRLRKKLGLQSGKNLSKFLIKNY